ncbi:MAG TPA: DUF2064 domain-containing protein [Thermoanaerobaculia bacterium]|nr:DUF2064 domain-containing protein [Thermoanaerobaculia bacterium]
MSQNRRCIILFARSPRAEEEAKRIRRGHRLFAHLRQRIADAAAAVEGAELVEITSEPAAGTGRWLPQRGDSFDVRLRNAFEDVRALGYSEVIAIPIDVPGIEARDLAEAFELLASHDHVIGPSPDGGVYLIGMRRNPAALFDGVHWNSSSVFSEMIANDGAAAVLRMLHDVDAATDLEAALAEAVDPRTRSILFSLLAGSTGVDPAALSPPASREGEPRNGRAPPSGT